MATRGPAPTSRRSDAATGIAIAGVAVSMVGLIRLGIGAGQETTLELIDVLRGSTPGPEVAAARLPDLWELAILLIGVALVIVAAAAKVFHRRSWSWPADATSPRSSTDGRPSRSQRRR